MSTYSIKLWPDSVREPEATISQFSKFNTKDANQTFMAVASRLREGEALVVEKDSSSILVQVTRKSGQLQKQVDLPDGKWKLVPFDGVAFSNGWDKSLRRKGA